jgi:hypothetical protein
MLLIGQIMHRKDKECRRVLMGHTDGKIQRTKRDDDVKMKIWVKRRWGRGYFSTERKCLRTGCSAAL